MKVNGGENALERIVILESYSNWIQESRAAERVKRLGERGLNCKGSRKKGKTGIATRMMAVGGGRAGCRV
jgi:hypothetical protein